MYDSPFSEERRQAREKYALRCLTLTTIAAVIGIMYAYKLVTAPAVASAAVRTCEPASHVVHTP